MKKPHILTPFAVGLVFAACETGSGGSPSTQAPSTSINQGGQSPNGTNTAVGGTATGATTSVSNPSSGGTSNAGTTVPVTPGSYALPAPSECSNQFSVQGCRKGVSTSTCGGLCSNDYGPTSKNACESGKDGVPVQYACPRDILFSDEMVQAAKDDGFDGKFNYAIVGHDPDTGNLDKELPNSCCQCYQLVFDKPTYLTNSVLTPPKPLVVQSANTQASGALGFDVFMGAGGLGVFNACNAGLGLGNSYGYSQYATYPSVGQAFSGGVKPGPDSLKCNDANNNLTDALISAPSCQQKVTDACNQITATNATSQAETRKSCIQSNQANSYYHENWNVYAKRVACPTHLMEVTGCKLASQAGLAVPSPDVQTAAQASAAGFSSGYHTTTMQDCCMPTCAWKNNVNVATVGGYNTFYSCLADGTPVTQ